MGLFNLFNRKNGSGHSSAENLPDVPENVFVEKEKLPEGYNGESNGTTNVDYSLNYLYQFLDQNFEARGYDDALVNPDTTHMEQNIEGLKNDFNRAIMKVKSFYDGYLNDLEVHITTRSKSGMVDIVEELNAKKETAENHVKQVAEIEAEAKNNSGAGQGIILSYTRGFRNGLAAITHHSILRKNL